MRSKEKDPTEPGQPVSDIDPKKFKGKPVAADADKLASGGKRGSDDLQDMGHPKK